jgi:hypothetical protein
MRPSWPHFIRQLEIKVGRISLDSLKLIMNDWQINGKIAASGGGIYLYY